LQRYGVTVRGNVTSVYPPVGVHSGCCRLETVLGCTRLECPYRNLNMVVEQA
jgi:hypothetical protein